MTTVAQDLNAERAVMGAVLLHGEATRVAGLVAGGLRPEHFSNRSLQEAFTAAVSLSDRLAALDPITVAAEIDRLGLTGISPEGLTELMAAVPAAGNIGDYADRVMELARWRARQRTAQTLLEAVQRRDGEQWAKALTELDMGGGGTRTDSYSASDWAALLFDFFAKTEEEASKYAIPSPWAQLNTALGGGLFPGEWMALSGPTSHGKSIIADQWIDSAVKHGKRCHLYMTEMTAITRGMRLLARRTGVPFVNQRARNLTADQRKKLVAELALIDFGCTIAADWDVDDIVRDALRARYDFVVVDLIHGFHYEDERALDRISKAMQRLARVSTTLNGFDGTAVLAVTHLKEEGINRAGKIPRPTITSIKGGSSIKQDAEFVGFVWQDQEEDGALTGEAEFWLPKARSGGLVKLDLRLNVGRIRFELPSVLDAEATAF